MTPGDEEFRRAFEAARVSRAQLARYYLRALEMAAAGEREPWFMPTQDPTVINLKHVLPKKPEGNWPQFSVDEAAMYVNRLGNQVLLQASSNAALKSERFAEKRPLYGTSPYLLTKMVAEVEDWAPHQIARRQEELARLALIAWPA